MQHILKPGAVVTSLPLQEILRESQVQWGSDKLQQDDEAVQSKQKISKLDYVLSEPALDTIHSLPWAFGWAFSRQSSYSLLCWQSPSACRRIVALDNHLLKWNANSHVCSRRNHSTANQLKVAYWSLGVGTILPLQIHSKEVTGILK